MCGISGMYHTQRKVDENILRKFNMSLSHRGPDAQGTYFANNHHVGLGHCRLSIVDVSSNSNQPFVSNDGQLILTFNGEIYNYLELRDELISHGYQFKTNSDTEVLLIAYQHWGEECLSKFNGMWAFAIWDDRKKQLFIARDRFGVKSVYYRYDGEIFAFASEQKAFKYHPEGLDICASQAGYFIQHAGAEESQRNTLYKNLKKLLPGEYLTVSVDGVKHVRWWNTYESLLNASNSELSAEYLKMLFSDSCDLRTRTDVKIATTLSGGLDSSAVTSKLAIINDLKSTKQLKSFIGSFKNEDMDEFQWAKRVVDRYDIDYKRIRISHDDAIENIENSCLALEDINNLPVIGQWKIYQAMHNEGYKVSIEGHAGDELLAGYYRYLKVHMGDILRKRESPEVIATLIRALNDMMPSQNSAQLRGNILQAPLDSSSLHNGSKRGKIYLKNLLFGEENRNEVTISERSLDSYSQESVLFQSLYEDFHYYSLPTILRNYDRLSMQHSVEIRSPFLDYRFVLAAFKADSEFKLSGGRTKSLLRDYFTYIPSDIRNRKDKSGFTPPFKVWLKKGLAKWIVSFTEDSIVQNSSLFDGQALNKTMQKCFKNKEFDRMALFWPLINLAILEKGGCRL